MLNEAKRICLNAINKCLPDVAVKKALEDFDTSKDVYLLAVGKAAYTMAKAANEVLNIKKGIVISKYGHINGKLENIECFEAGHPILDENSILATEHAIKLFSDLNKDDVVIFLLSGGASALFEKPLISLDELSKLNDQMLRKGLNIFEINTIRKKLSEVKGGKFAKICEPAQIYSIILSDVLSDQLDVIGSAPTVSDSTSGKDALDIINKYDLTVDEKIIRIISNSQKVEVDNSINKIIGSVRLLCEYAIDEAKQLGYRPILLNDNIDINCIDAGNYLFSEIKKYKDSDEKIALIMGGETTVNVKGDGLGGRNQELVFSQIKNIKGMNNVLIMSLGSDGSDGPTDAAGGYVDGNSYQKLLDNNIDFDEVLSNNDSYHGLEKIDGLIKTGPTGTNVNDISIALIN